ncbi:endonuclease/exonuclease/phosphatase family protein [Xanthobacter flavus]|uniref:endonuclease/exonuclease/phosphatase family protein n=1 Tax=Xanthobacter flavus TaxID=281 RepID=UPI00372652D6
MTNFFVPHIFMTSSTILFLALLRRRLIIPATLIWLLAGIPFVVVADEHGPLLSSGGVVLRTGTFNVMSENRNFSDLARQIRAEELDIASFQEVGSNFWSRSLKSLADYPETSLRNGVNSANSVVISRLPLDEVTMLPGTERQARWPLLSRAVLAKLVAIALDGMPAQAVAYFSIHPETPRDPSRWRSRNAYLDAVAVEIAKLPVGTHVVVAGDFNTPPWSPFFQDFLKRTGLRDAAQSPWPAPTRAFREFGLPPSLGTPVDHILVSAEITVSDFRNGSDYGSDHLPLIATLLLGHKTEEETGISARTPMLP